MGPHMKELGQMWRDLPSDTKDAYDDAAQEINRASSSTESPADIAKRVYADVQDVAKTLCELPELHKNGTHLLVMGCSSSGEPFVLSSSPAVRAYYDKNILHYSGMMDVPAIEEEASNRRPESAAVNMSMSNDNIEMNIRGFFKGLYGRDITCYCRIL